MTWIITASGRRFDLLNPQPDAIAPRDIAFSLAKICRFNGHCTGHYSVAEHSLRVAELVAPEHKLAALLHDATEAYVGDMVSPLKQMLPAYQQIEQRIWHVICDRFGINPTLPEEVHQADLTMLATERRDLMPAHPDQWACLVGITPISSTIKPLSAIHARFQYEEALLEALGGDL